MGAGDGFLLIKPGSLHKANGGYPAHRRAQIVARRSWEALKRTIKARDP